MSGFGIIGMCLGALGFVFSLSCQNYIDKQKKEIQELKGKVEDLYKSCQ